MSLADNLRTTRNKQKITQQEIADFIGVDIKTYARWESGEVSIKDPYIPKIAECLHVEIGDLFREKSSEIVINQHNNHTDNKDGSINGIVLVITDKKDIAQIMNNLRGGGVSKGGE
jgi:transcriptional regulator with XRE-family HTH domain